MASTIRRLEFDEVCDLFTSLGAHNSPSEMHGLLSGQLAAGRRLGAGEWLQEAHEFIDTDSSLSRDEEERLQFVYMATLTALADDELGFYPLLPDEDHEMELRLGCLGLWCQGFLAGFALVEKEISNLPEIVNDALHDLAAIAQVGINESEEWNEAAEADFFQIVEYVRLAAMNIFMEYAVEEAERNLQAMEEPQGYLTAQSLFKTRKLH